MCVCVYVCASLYLLYREQDVLLTQLNAWLPHILQYVRKSGRKVQVIICKGKATIWVSQYWESFRLWQNICFMWHHYFRTLLQQEYVLLSWLNQECISLPAVRSKLLLKLWKGFILEIIAFNIFNITCYTHMMGRRVSAYALLVVQFNI